MNWLQRLFLLRKRECCIRISVHWVAGGDHVYTQCGTEGDSSAMAAGILTAMGNDDNFRMAVEMAAALYQDPARTKHTLT